MFGLKKSPLIKLPKHNSTDPGIHKPNPYDSDDELDNKHTTLNPSNKTYSEPSLAEIKNLFTSRTAHDLGMGTTVIPKHLEELEITWETSEMDCGFAEEHEESCSREKAAVTAHGQNSIKVCRLCQQQDEILSCSICGKTDNVWAFLVCGFLGCGRYKEGHSIRHWKETHHCYSLDLQTQQIWDYVGDSYIHRLNHSKIDGKMNNCCQSHEGDCGLCECSEDTGISGAIFNSKVDSV